MTPPNPGSSGRAGQHPLKSKRRDCGESQVPKWVPSNARPPLSPPLGGSETPTTSQF